MPLFHERHVPEDVHARVHAELTERLAVAFRVLESRRSPAAGQRSATRNDDAAARQRISAQVLAIKKAAKVAVEQILGAIGTDAASVFDSALKRAEPALAQTPAKRAGQ